MTLRRERCVQTRSGLGQGSIWPPTESIVLRRGSAVLTDRFDRRTERQVKPQRACTARSLRPKPATNELIDVDDELVGTRESDRHG
jgi:hypothetical protein